MARIRTIKPEFPQSETVGRLSRDARLLFIMLWTLVDDEGRARANSRMLASLLFPYDDDVPELIGEWLDELEGAECIRRYEVDGSNYLDIPNWLKHQKIDKPTASKLPAFVDGSPAPREASRKVAPDLGPGPGKEMDGASAPTAREATKSVDAEFEAEFWPRYSNKVGKPKALQAYRAARRKVDAGTILDGLDRYIRTKPPDRKWLNPATFLNQARWADEPAPEPAGRGPPATNGNHFASLANRIHDARHGLYSPPDPDDFATPEFELEGRGIG